MLNDPLKRFFEIAQDNLLIDEYGHFESGIKIQRHVTVEMWERARQALSDLKSEPVRCEQGDLKKLVDFINTANAVGLTCRFIEPQDVTGKDKTRGFDRAGIELHITL